MTLVNSDVNSIEFLIGDKLDLAALKQIPPFQLGDEKVLSFARDIASFILENKIHRQNVSLSSLAFWLYRISTNELQLQNSDYPSKWGRGLVFHIAPANVPLNFAYSLFTGLVSGNTNIIRVSSRESEDSNTFIEILREVLKNASHKDIRERILIVRFDKETQFTSLISSFSDVRIIWGGDAAIHTIRQHELPSNAIEVVFPNKYSIFLTHAEKVLNLNEEKSHDLFRRFYNDTFLSDQNACSSPSLLIWLGDEDLVKNAQAKFWTGFMKFVAVKYEISA